jgi:hypothetical protein
VALWVAAARPGNAQAVSIPPAAEQAGSPLFRISNHHTDDSGPVPAIDGDEAGRYYGYFANQHGEQAVFVYDYRLARRLSGLGSFDSDGPAP